MTHSSQKVILQQMWTLTTKADPLAVRVNPYSAGIDFRRQNLTSVDVSF